MQMINSTPATSIPFYYPNEMTVTENRAGQLTWLQVEELQVKQLKVAVTYLISTVFFIGFGIYIAKPIVDPDGWFMPIYNPTFVLLGFFLFILPGISFAFWGIYRFVAFLKDIKTPVASIKGTIQLTATLGDYRYPSKPQVKISWLTFEVKWDVLLSLPNNVECTVYYAPNSNTLLSVAREAPLNFKP